MLPTLGRERKASLLEAKKKSILLLSIMCNMFAHSHTPDTLTKQTRDTSVIYPPFADQTKAHKNKKTTSQYGIFVQPHGAHIPILHPRGLGPPPPRNVSGGL